VVLRRKSITCLAAGLLSVTAVVAGCSPAPLTDVHQILDNAVTAMTPNSNVLATTGPGKIESFHFVLDAGGQFLVGIATTTPTPSPLPTASSTASPTASATASPSAAASPASPTPLSSAAASASASAAAAHASASASAAVASAAAASASAVAAESSASAAAAYAAASASAAAVSPTPSPTPYYTALPFGLKDAHAEGDIDLLHQAARITGWMPSIAGISGEILVIDPYCFTRTYGETQYQVGYASSLPINPATPTGAYYIIEQALKIASDSSVSPVLVGTEDEPYGKAYHVRVQITPNVANDKLGASGQLLGSGELNLWILQDGFWLERMEFSTSDPTAGAAAIRIVFSNFNNVPAIDIPPDKQIFVGSPSPSVAP
jgi:hypothetical protein